MPRTTGPRRPAKPRPMVPKAKARWVGVAQPRATEVSQSARAGPPRDSARDPTPSLLRRQRPGHEIQLRNQRSIVPESGPELSEIEGDPKSPTAKEKELCEIQQPQKEQDAAHQNRDEHPKQARDEQDDCHKGHPVRSTKKRSRTRPETNRTTVTWHPVRITNKRSRTRSRQLQLLIRPRPTPTELPEEESPKAPTAKPTTEAGKHKASDQRLVVGSGAARPMPKCPPKADASNPAPKPPTSEPAAPPKKEASVPAAPPRRPILPTFVPAAPPNKEASNPAADKGTVSHLHLCHRRH